MLITQNISSLLLVVALGASADAYGRRRKVERTDKVDDRGGREAASVEDFDTSDKTAPGVDIFDVEVFDAEDFDASNRPSVEDFDGKESGKIGEENFWAPPSLKTKESTKRRPLGSWSSWSFFQRPTRTRVKTTKSPRSIQKSPMTMPDTFAVKRIVIFPCQDQNLRCKNKTK